MMRGSVASVNRPNCADAALFTMPPPRILTKFTSLNTLKNSARN